MLVVKEGTIIAAQCHPASTQGRAACKQNLSVNTQGCDYKGSPNEYKLLTQPKTGKYEFIP